MPKGHVTQLMRHDTGELALVVGLLKHSAVDEHRTARERKGVKIARVDPLKVVPEFRMLKLRRDRRHQPVADTREILLGILVIDERKLLFHLICRFLAELNVVSGAVFVLW